MEYFKKTPPEKFRFLDFYSYRQKQDDFTRSFREESGNLWRCLKSLVKESATGVRLATEVPRRGNILPWLRRGVQPALWWFPVMFRNYCESRSLTCSPEKGYILAQLRQGVQPALWWFPVRHRTKFEDVHTFWQRIENETSIDNAETEVACKFIHRSSRVIDVALTNVEEKMKQNRKHANKEGECSTRRLGNSASNDYDVNLSETEFSNMDYEEKESDKRKLSESDYEPSSSPISSDSGNDRKKKLKRSNRKQPKSKVIVRRERDCCSSTNKYEDNPAPAIMMAGGDAVESLPPLSSLLPIPPLPLLPPPGSINSVLNNVIIPKDLPTLVNQDQLSPLLTNPIIQTPGTPPPRPNVNNIQITPQKLMLFKESVTYLPNHIKIDVNDEGMIIKDNHTSEEISGIIRNWLIMALTSPKEEFVKAIMTPLSSEASPKDCDFRQICEFVLYDFYFMTKKGPLKRDIGELELDCMREAKKIFPKFDLPIYQADGLGVRNSSKKEVVFIEILGGPENTDQKKLKEDSEKLLKEAVFGLVSLLRNYLDKSVEESKQLYTFMIQGIGNHVYKVSQIKSATLPFEFIDVADYLAVFEFLYILVSELEIQTRVINKLRLSESADGVIVPRIRDWIWLPDSISAWECEEIQNENP
ncbi:9668_t:CDS:10 [Cetraspora pellucida]|uniref:9668_t:CDS:1 n=1 Tax=Cetraspora pellucida TaxID=1433469 RepID=A0A9N9EEW0_9GLOM|nr:9668_t:CDS:10 [Cetraspora pellucida]